MSLNLEQKQAVVTEVTAQVAAAEAAMLAEYRGLTVSQMTDLRRKARESEVWFRVVKNTLARRAVQGSQFECLKDAFQGPLALALGKDPVKVAKVLSEFAKDNEHLVIKAGAMGGKLIPLDQVQALAALPSREQLIATLLATLQAPVTQFVRTLNEVPTKFVRALAAVRDSKQASA